MRKSYILIFSLIIVPGLLFMSNCSMDESEPDLPIVELTDQVVSIAMGNGDNTRHTGGNFMLDWNGDADATSNPLGFQTVPVYHVSSEAPSVGNYYVLTNEDGHHQGEGDPREIIDPIWDTVDWTTLSLSLIEESVENYTNPPTTRGADITQLRVKAIYNYQRKYIAFLFQWEDESKDYMKDFWKCIEPDYSQGVWKYGVWERHFDYDSDWLSLMFSTWRARMDGDTLLGFDQIHLTYQQEGCSSTCHTDARPYHYNEFQMEDPEHPGQYIDQVCDLWYWCASRTNYGDPTGLTELGGEMLDGRLNTEGGVSGDYNDPTEKYYPPEYAVDDCKFGYIAYDRFNWNFQYDDGSPGYKKNSWRIPLGPNLKGYTHWWLHPDNAEDGTLWFPYLWVPLASIGTTRTYGSMSPDMILYADVPWVVGSTVTGYVSSPAMANCISIRSTGIYADGMWTLLIVRDLDTGDSDDVNLDIFVPAGQQ